MVSENVDVQCPKLKVNKLLQFFTKDEDIS